MLQTLTITNMRAVNAALSLSPRINIIYGDNGSGKSTILEAIHLLAFGRSFRTAKLDSLISQGKNELIVHATLQQPESVLDIGFSRLPGETQARCDHVKSPLSKLSAHCPALFVDSDTYREFFANPAFRRRMFDWLVFHVKPGFVSAMRRYNAGLRNRNYCLKHGMDIRPWTSVMAASAELIHSDRLAVFELLHVYLDETHHDFLSGLCARYAPGYAAEEGLEACLAEAWPEDLRRGHTTVGPHRADWVFSKAENPVIDRLSQGQLKSAYFHIMCCQKELLVAHGVSPILMIDDYSAELDSSNEALLFKLIGETSQVLLTSTSSPEKQEGESRRFHVKQGKIFNIK